MYSYLTKNIDVRLVHAGIKFICAPKGKKNYIKRKMISISTCKELLEKEQKNKEILSVVCSLGCRAHNITDAIMLTAGYLGKIPH